MNNVFSEELLLGDNKKYWGDESGLLYFFLENGKGYFLNTENLKTDFAWIINSNGLLAIKNLKNKEVFLLKIEKNEIDGIICKKYKKEKNDITYVSDLLLIYDSYEDIEKEENDNLKKDFFKELKSYQIHEYFIFVLIFFFFIFIMFFILNNVPIIKTSPNWLIFSIITIIMFYIKGIYYIFSKKIILNIRKWVDKK